MQTVRGPCVGLFGPQGIGFEGLLQLGHMPTEFAKHGLAAVGRLLTSPGALSQLRTVLRDSPMVHQQNAQQTYQMTIDYRRHTKNALLPGRR